MNTRIPALMITAAAGALLSSCAETKPAAVTKPAPVTKPETVPGNPAKSAKSVTSEAFGPLTLGQKPADVIRILGEPQSKGKKVEMGATGTEMQTWNYPAKGLTITMEFIGAEPSVHIIDATSPCSFATARGIRIGSPEAAVIKAYAKERSQHGSNAGENFLAGSIYGGLDFSFERGKVTRIYVGVAAE